MTKFKEGKLQVLVATDVAARGLDIDDLPLVVNYELPHTPEDYVHRIGRTGRAGASGEAISFVAPEEEKYLVEIERMLKKKVAVESEDRIRSGRRRGTHADARTQRTCAAHRTPPDARSERPRHAAAAATPAEPREPAAPSRRASAIAARATAMTAAAPANASATRSTPTIPTSRLISRPAEGANGKSALMHGSGAHRHGTGRSKPIPALLMKKRAPEPENA